MPDPFAQDESLMTARQAASAADSQDFNATILTNFDNELDEMDAQYDRHKSRQLLENFWALILLFNYSRRFYPGWRTNGAPPTLAHNERHSTTSSEGRPPRVAFIMCEFPVVVSAFSTPG